MNLQCAFKFWTGPHCLGPKLWRVCVELGVRGFASLILKWRYHGWIDLPTVRQFSVCVRDPSWTAFAHHWLSRPSAVEYSECWLGFCSAFYVRASLQGSFQGARRLSGGCRCWKCAHDPILLSCVRPQLTFTTLSFKLGVKGIAVHCEVHLVHCVWGIVYSGSPPGVFLTVYACSLALGANSVFTTMIVYAIADTVCH